MLPPTWLSGALQWPLWASACCLGLLVCLLSLHVVEKLWVAHKSGQNMVKEQPTATADKALARFQRQYLVVYGLVMFADWLQGTHMYSLYQSYGVNVGALFLTGFLSSVVFGNFVGPLVDKYGRRKACLVYCALEIAINLLEGIPMMEVLLLGRVLGGISTSLLFSAFESWMVTEHRVRGFSEGLLGKTFALGSEINGVVAVVAGLVAQVTADEFGDIGPFRAAVVLTAVAAAFVVSWSENYGSRSKSTGKDAQKKITESSNVKCSSTLNANAYALGFCYSLFEGAMYVFVFLWYPTLESVLPNGVLPSGLVFSSFMLCIAIGGKLFDLIENSWLREEQLLVLTTATSAISLLSPTVRSGGVAMFFSLSSHLSMLFWHVKVTDDYQYILAGFVVFEVRDKACWHYPLLSVSYSDLVRLRGASLKVCVGVVSPCCATLRGRYFPKDQLSTTLSLFRLPTNILVVVGTGGASYLTSDQLYYGCTAVLVIATGCAEKLVRSSSTESTSRRKLKAQ